MRRCFDRIIVFMIRKKFGLKKMELFRFTNQKTTDIYYFTERSLNKIVEEVRGLGPNIIVKSEVSLNWLLDDECKIVKYDLTILSYDDIH